MKRLFRLNHSFAGSVNHESTPSEEQRVHPQVGVLVEVPTLVAIGAAVAVVVSIVVFHLDVVVAVMVDVMALFAMRDRR